MYIMYITHTALLYDIFCIIIFSEHFPSALLHVKSISQNLKGYTIKLLWLTVINTIFTILHMLQRYHLPCTSIPHSGHNFQLPSITNLQEFLRISNMHIYSSIICVLFMC